MQISNSFKFYYDSNCWNKDGTQNITADINDDDEYFYSPNWTLGCELTLFDSSNGYTHISDEKGTVDQVEAGKLHTKIIIDRNLGTARFEVTEFTPWARKYLPDHLKIWKVQDIEFGSRIDADDATDLLTHFILNSFVTCELTTKITK